MFIEHLRHNKYYRLLFLIPSFLVSSWAIFLLIERIFAFPNQRDRAIATIFYFTTQSNLLVWIILAISFTKLIHRSWFRYLSFIALINILMTGLIFHIFLSSFLDVVELMQHVLHTIVPIIYIVYYMLFLSHKISYKSCYIGLIYPLIYLALVYLFIEPLFGEKLNAIYPNLTSAHYIYPFLDPLYYQSGVYGLIGFILGVLAPSITLLSVLMIYVISQIHKTSSSSEL